METVQIQCGSCHRVMAINVAHLGSQVHCPHCQAIVQTPARAPEKRGEGGETESIFSPPEASDDIFNSGPNKPLVEMPTLERTSPDPHEPVATVPYMPIPNLNLDRPAEEPPRPSLPQSASAWSETSALAESSPSDHVGLAELGPRRLEKKSAVAPILLIFLVPYAILATLVIAYLLFNQSRLFDPMERLPDPKPKDGGPRVVERVAHESPLPGKLKTTLNKPLQIGSLQVTPLKVQLTPEHQLILHLKMKNVSSDVVFNPISYEFLKYAQGSMHTSRPYTYLDTREKKLYGGFPEWLKGPEGQEQIFNGEIGPGQEELIRISTDPKYRGDVQRLANSQEALVWRVQVRRGFVEVRGTQVSATAVVGVEFNARAITKEG